MTVQELQDLVSEQIGHPVSGLQTLERRTGGTSGDFFDRDEVLYTGLATTLEHHLELKWTFKKFGDDWYFSSEPTKS